MYTAMLSLICRNIIEKEHKALVDRRHTHFSEADHATLTQFKQAKDGEWQKERQQTRLPQLRPAVWITVLFLTVLFCGLVSIVAVSREAAGTPGIPVCSLLATSKYHKVSLNEATRGYLL